MWSRDLHTVITVNDCFFGAAKLTKYADSDKYSYSDMILDLIHNHIFYFQILTGLTILLFLM